MFISATEQLPAGWSDRIDVVSGRCAGLDAVLIRPDGYIAWVAPGAGELAGALERWFGSARAAVPA